MSSNPERRRNSGQVVVATLLLLGFGAAAASAGLHTHAPTVEDGIAASSTRCVACALSHVPALSTPAPVSVAAPAPLVLGVWDPADLPLARPIGAPRHGRAPPAC